MTKRNVAVLSGNILLISIAGLCGTAQDLGGEDSPITVADGSINFHRDKGKFQHDFLSGKHHWVADDPRAFASSVECPNCSPAAPRVTLTGKQWTLTLNENTKIVQHGTQKHRFDIRLNTSPSVKADRDVTMGQPGQDPHLNGASTLTFADGSTPQTFNCPRQGCKIVIHYCVPTGSGIPGSSCQ